MSETPSLRLLRELEEDVSSVRDRARVFRRLAEALEGAGDVSRAEDALTEARAFELYGNDNGEAFPGYFQPPVAVVGGATDPPLGFFTPQRLEHLANRALATNNPIHAARFADVAWDFGMRGFEVAKLAVEKYLECLELYKVNRWSRELEEAAKRAARLAHMLRNEELSSKVKERLLEHARGFDTSQEYEPCVDIAEALAGAPRLGLTEDQVKEVLEILDRATSYYQEEHLAREAAFGDVEGPDEFMVRLAHQVRIELGGNLVDRPTERLEINRSLEREADARRRESPLAALSLYEKAYSGFLDLHAPADLERTRVKLREVGVVSRSSMQAIEFEFGIPRSAIEGATEHLFDQTLEATLKAIAGAQSLVPNVERAQISAEERRSASLTEALAGRRLHLSGGYLIRSSTGPDQIAEALLADELTFQITTTYAAVRQHLFGQLVADYGLDADSLENYFRGWGIYSEDNLALLHHGFDRYFADDQISALHVLIPRFEALVRDILNAVGRPTADPASGGTFTLGTLLRDTAFKSAAGADLLRYYEVTLTMPGLGMNLRNSLAHGTLHVESMHAANTELMLHLLLTLTRFQPYPLEEEPDASSQESV